MDTPAWLKFAELCKELWDRCTFQDELVRACGGNPDIAWVAFYHLEEESIDWLHGNIPALDDARPVDLIASGNADLVRMCLWRFP